MTEQRRVKACATTCIVGTPNAGKSTLINRLMGQKVSIVSSKVQTTRSHLTGIMVEDHIQLLLIDTPGFFPPRRRLDHGMRWSVRNALEGADIHVLMIDSTTGITADVERLVAQLKESKRPAQRFLALNKIDRVKKPQLLDLAMLLNKSLDFNASFMISAEKGDGVEDLKTKLIEVAPEGPWLYPPGQLVDAPQRIMVSEITREQIFLQTHQELPYDSLVITESYSEKQRKTKGKKPDSAPEITIKQAVYVARPSQKAIILGHKGKRIKSLGIAARKMMEEHLDCKVHLFLHVIVKPDWEKDRSLIEAAGLPWTLPPERG